MAGMPKMGSKKDKKIDAAFKRALIPNVYTLIKKIAGGGGGYQRLEFGDIIVAGLAADTPMVSEVIDTMGLSSYNFLVSLDFAVVDYYIYYALRDGVDAVDMDNIISQGVVAKNDDIGRLLLASPRINDRLIRLIVQRIAGVKLLAIAAGAI
jgi:hypothetical protein